MDDVRCNWHTVGTVEGDRGWSCPMCPNPADIDRLRDELEQERRRRQDDLIGQQYRDDEIERLRVEARDQRFVIEALNASVDRMERDLAWWRERERTRLAAATQQEADRD